MFEKGMVKFTLSSPSFAVPTRRRRIQQANFLIKHWKNIRCALRGFSGEKEKNSKFGRNGVSETKEAAAR